MPASVEQRFGLLKINSTKPAVIARKGIVMSIAIAVVALAVGIGIVATLIATNKGPATPRLWQRSRRYRAY
jgi:hypothetical protein